MEESIYMNKVGFMTCCTILYIFKTYSEWPVDRQLDGFFDAEEVDKSPNERFNEGNDDHKQKPVGAREVRRRRTCHTDYPKNLKRKEQKLKKKEGRYEDEVCACLIIADNH